MDSYSFRYGHKKGRRLFLKNAALISSGLLLANNVNSLPASILSHNRSYTANQIIEILLKSNPGKPIQNTVDIIKYGDGNQIVTGIVTTMFATEEVIKRATALGANFIIAHEPTFYNHADDIKWLENDPVYFHKIDLLKKNNIVVWRYHDYIHAHQPDGVLIGVLDATGWIKYYDPSNPNVINIPGINLQSIIELLKDKLGIEHLKFMGDPSKICSKISILPGAYGGMRQIQSLQKQRPDLLIVGELNEWETSEYVRDAQSAGITVALIVLGHIVSEEPGMIWLVQWFKENIPGMKVTHVPSRDAFKWA